MNSTNCIRLFFTIIILTTVATAQLTHTTTRKTVNGRCGAVQESVFSNWAYADSFGSHAFSGSTFTVPISHIVVSGKIETCPGSSSTLDTNSTDDQGYHLHAVGSGGAVTFLGSITPKYVVVGVIYAPPGAKSTVDYGNSTLLGTSTSLTNSFTSSTSVTVSESTSVSSIFGLTPSGGITNTAGTSFSQEADTSSSLSINKMNSSDIIVPGPLSSAVGLDHDFDIVLIWLNPVANFTIGPASTAVQWTGYSYDARDPVVGLDIIPLELAQLKNPALITDPNTLQSLARTWAAAGQGLTNTDLLNIAGRDPFSNPSYTVTVPVGSTCTSDNRFCITTNQDIAYQPPAPGGQPITEKYSTQYQTTTTQGQSATDTYAVSFSTDVNAHGGFLVDFTVDIKSSQSFTWTNKWSATRTNTTGQTASLSITGPATTDNYTGPTAFNVFQDNVYGTFMFSPAN